MIRRPLAAALAALAAVPAARAQEYTAAQLDCARYHEWARSEIETETGGRVQRARAEREGWWSFRARDTAGGIALEGWYDSLALRHGSGDTLTAPDTDGILGGRFRGLLHPTGQYQPLAAPFVPPEVAEAADAASALDDLLPRLPPPGLAVSARWSDGAGLELERLPDSAASGRALWRYALRRRAESSEAVPRGDTVPVPLRQTTLDDARIVWDPVAGLLRRVRDSRIEATIPAGGRIRAPVRTRVLQHAELHRLPSAGSCP
ncbi:MAG TPA: hypothetical protein VMN37_11590 [Gemmatimonadales bacterium]|nr:hypothetical protein [Gemmatimonadales bacterium]